MGGEIITRGGEIVGVGPGQTQDCCCGSQACPSYYLVQRCTVTQGCPVILQFYVCSTYRCPNMSRPIQPGDVLRLPTGVCYSVAAGLWVECEPGQQPPDGFRCLPEGYESLVLNTSLVAGCVESCDSPGCVPIQAYLAAEACQCSVTTGGIRYNAAFECSNELFGRCVVSRTVNLDDPTGPYVCVYPVSRAGIVGPDTEILGGGFFRGGCCECCVQCTHRAGNGFEEEYPSGCDGHTGSREREFPVACCCSDGNQSITVDVDFTAWYIDTDCRHHPDIDNKRVWASGTADRDNPIIRVYERNASGSISYIEKQVWTDDTCTSWHAEQNLGITTLVDRVWPGRHFMDCYLLRREFNGAFGPGGVFRTGHFEIRISPNAGNCAERCPTLRRPDTPMWGVPGILDTPGFGPGGLL